MIGADLAVLFVPFLDGSSNRVEAGTDLEVFCVYSPTPVDHHRAECHTFYDELSSLVNDIHLRDHILICGDLNAPLTTYGCSVKHLCGELNRNIEALQAFINIRDLVAANGIM